ncbi:MAG TPA: hypothetical protein VEY87_02670 [Gaiellaceae bacterium]|nr:hypothetical protein [Gaiellaceae bacterium]
MLHRNDELETGAGTLRGRRVQEIAAVGASVLARDRESEPAPVTHYAAAETVEQTREEVRGDAGAAVGDAQTEVSIELLRPNLDRRRAVAQRVRYEVRHDPVEGDAIDVGLEPLVDLDLDLISALFAHEQYEFLDASTDCDTVAFDRDRPRIQPRHVEQLIDELFETAALRVQRRAKLDALVLFERRAALVQGRCDPVDHGCRCPEFVGGERDEIILDPGELPHLLGDECLFEQRCDQHGEPLEFVSQLLVECERDAAAISRDEAEGRVARRERKHHHRAQAEPARQPRRGNTNIRHEDDRLVLAIEQAPFEQGRCEVTPIGGDAGSADFGQHLLSEAVTGDQDASKVELVGDHPAELVERVLQRTFGLRGSHDQPIDVSCPLFHCRQDSPT